MSLPQSRYIKDRVRTKILYAICFPQVWPFVHILHDRLLQVDLKSLEERRLLSDLVLLFKIVYGISDINFANYFTLINSNYNLRRNSMQICPTRNHKNDQWRNSFFIRVVRVWNTLPEETVTSPTVSLFKMKLEKLDFSAFLKLDV